MHVTRTNDGAPLRRMLLLDAATSGAMGLMLLSAAGPLAPLLGLPTSLLRWTGVLLIPFSASLVGLARRTPAPLGGARAVVVANALWVVGSVALLLGGALSPTRLGVLFVLAQAAVVALFAYLEQVAVRRASATSLQPTTLRTDSAASAARSTT
jgi:hypothetical protein